MITRRRLLEAMGACVLSPAMTEGPFFVEEEPNRSDITAGRDGVPLLIQVSVVAARRDCAPLEGVRVDIWHADARGEYSDVGAARGQRFLRGYQVSDASGTVTFRTIYPGWYPGRAIHIHVKARKNGATYHFRELTTQFFFDEAVSEAVVAQPPYDAHGTRFPRNARDGIFRGGRGGALLVDVTPAVGARGYVGKATLGLDA
jgi:protocatechuate 3,4-dioxygenase beta subunit